MSDRQWYTDYQEKLKAEQGDKSRDEITEELKQKVEHVFDPATAPKQGHKFVDRGMKLSCEGAGHPYHQVWKQKPARRTPIAD